MTTQTDRFQSSATVSTETPLRSVAVVARNPCVNVLDALLEAGDYDVVFIESIDRAYSQIKRSTPQLVVLCLDMDDPGYFQILSMLKLDSATAGIPVITYVTEADEVSSSDYSSEIEPDTLSQPVIVPTN